MPGFFLGRGRQYMVSLKDVATACGVSISTASKALNHAHDINETTGEKIRQKALEMGYKPNSAARALKSKITHNIGVLFVDDASSGLTHPYFSQVLESFKNEVEQRGYDLTFINHHVGSEPMSYLEHCLYRNVDGVIIACVDFAQPEVIELVQSSIPTVTIDHVFHNCSTILSDNTEGMEELTDYIINKGHRRIAFVHGLQSSVTRARLVGFYKAMEKHRLPVPESYILEAPYQDGDASARAAQAILSAEKRPTCIIFPDDYSCIAGIHAIHDAGLSIPEDISVAGYDGIPLMQHMYPHLTTFWQNMPEIGRQAAIHLIDLIEKPRTTKIEMISVSGKVLPGDTVKALKKPAS